MMSHITPPTEIERLYSLSEFDIDYSALDNNFKDLALLAAKIAGTEISLVNLIDSATQWTVSNYGLEVKQMTREESICKYTIANGSPFEVADLSKDERFKNRFFVQEPFHLKYYMGIPLTTTEGSHIGTLCVIDRHTKSLSDEQIKLLKIVADEVVIRLNSIKMIESLKHKVIQINDTKKKIAHDIRGPIAGIIGLTGLIHQQGENNDLEEVLDCIALIQKSGKSVLELADSILHKNSVEPIRIEEFNLLILKAKLEHLYTTQAEGKNIHFEIKVNQRNAHISFLKNKLLQITGNVIDYALKFTPENGFIKIDLDLTVEATNNMLKVKIENSGYGLDKNSIELIMEGQGSTVSEFGLLMVKNMVQSLEGNFEIHSDIDKGTLIEMTIPQQYLPNVSFNDSL